MKGPKDNQEKPVVVLVHDWSFLRLWMERALSHSFRVCVFSSTEDALTFVRSTEELDVLITELDLGLSALGGCNIARDVEHRFPNALVFVFSGATENDHRLVILRGAKGVRYLSKPLDALLVARRLKMALNHREKRN